MNGGPSVVLEYGTVSRALADGMLRLLGHLGVVAAVRTADGPARVLVDTYWLRISGADQAASALWLFPDDEAEQIRRTVAAQHKRIAPTGYRRLDGDTAWVRVTGTRREHYRGPVHSLEVPGAHTIVSTGGLVTHNCFPKDVDAFLHLSRNVGYDFRLLEEVARINAGQRDVVLDKLRDELWHLSGKTIAVLGAAFKPGTDDLREAPGAAPRPGAPRGGRDGADLRPGRDPRRAARGARPRHVHRPVRGARRRPRRGRRHRLARDHRARPGQVAEALDYPILVDGRNCLDPAAARAAGLRYHAMGRGHLDV